MELEIATFEEAKGWTCLPDPHLDSERTLVLAFGDARSPGVSSAVRDLAAAFPSSHLLGCSTAGEILGDTVSDGSLCVAVVRFHSTQLMAATAEVRSREDSFDAGRSLAEQLATPDLRGVLVLSDGLNINGSALVSGLNSLLPPTVVVSGGLAGDGDRFGATWVLSGDRIRAGVVAAVGFYGPHVLLGHGSRGGWDIFGPERTVTRADGAVLYELDGRPALALYKEYLGERARELPASALLFPLAIKSATDAQKQIVRTILAVDEQEQSLVFAGDIPEGACAQLMRANFDRLIDGASTAGADARSLAVFDSPTLSLAISCVGRRLILGGRTEEELEAALESQPAGTKQVGFYSYGEISPFATGHCDLHNQTMTITTIGELAA
jgi:hypothetical protein